MPPKPDNAATPIADATARDTLSGDTNKPVEPTRAERLNAVHTQAARLMEELQAEASGEPKEQLPLVLGLISQVKLSDATIKFVETARHHERVQ